MSESTQSLPWLPGELITRIMCVWFAIEMFVPGVNIDDNYTFPTILQINRYFRRRFSGWYYGWTRFYFRGDCLLDLETCCERFLNAMPEKYRHKLDELEIQHVRVPDRQSLYFLGVKDCRAGPGYTATANSRPEATKFWWTLAKYFRHRLTPSGMQFELPDCEAFQYRVLWKLPKLEYDPIIPWE